MRDRALLTGDDALLDRADAMEAEIHDRFARMEANVRGGQQEDSLSGGCGDDFVSGDKGDDTMTGGAGAELFHSFGDAGIDRVLDFNLAEGDRVITHPNDRIAESVKVVERSALQ